MNARNARLMSDDTLPFTTESYLHAKSVWKGVPIRRRARAVTDSDGDSVPFGKGREPRPLESILQFTARQMGWTEELAQAQIITDWARFVGDRLAGHTEIIGIQNGILQVQCDSTSWATELRRLRGEILTRMMEEYPEASIGDIRFLAPGAPTWRHGPRSVRGRGPRDTYG